MAEAPTAERVDAAETARVAGVYFAALRERDIDTAVALWEPGGHEHIRGQVDAAAPDGVRDFLGGLFGSFPDFRFEVVETTVQDDRAAVRWRATGTFAGVPFQGIEPNGTRIDFEGIDVLVIRDGRIVANDAVPDGVTLLRQVGLLPPQGSPMEQRMTRAFNFRTRLGRRLTTEPELIAEGVWVMRGGFPSKEMNVYLVRDGTGVLLYDGGIKAMTNAVAVAGASMGGITRVVLGHAHPDHRGVAPGLGAPVHCHPAERVDAEGDGGQHYFDFSKLDPHGRFLLPRLLKWWDGGPVKIAGTVDEDDEIAGFRVVHLPGHAPGLIGLWRESDRLALVSDCFYMLDPQTGKRGGPRVPHAAFNFDTEQARASIRRLAAMEPATAWSGHVDPLTGDVRAKLEQAADST